jgi:hypothetical protein
LELADYPPDHRKYNRIERCWGILEDHGSGAWLTSIDTALEWAAGNSSLWDEHGTNDSTQRVGKKAGVNHRTDVPAHQPRQGLVQ